MRNISADKMAKWAKSVTDLRKSGTTDKEIQIALRRDGNPLSLAEIDDHISSWANVFRTAGQGLSFGFGDEITAGVKSAFTDQTYDDAVAEERQKIKNYASANPAKALGLEVAGALPTMFVPGLGQARAASMGGRIGKAALQGGGEGALYGFGTGEGDISNRAKNAGQGAIFGAGGGTIMRGGIEALAPSIKKGFARMVGTSADEQRAKNILRDTTRYDGGPQAITQRAEAVAPTLRNDAVLGDLGENLQTTTSAVSNIAGDARSQIQPLMRGREDRAGSRIVKSVQKGLATKKPFSMFMADEISEITKAQRKASGPVYREAFEEMDLTSQMGSLSQLAKHPLIIKASKGAKDFVEVGEKFDLKNTSNPRTWDLIKHGLDKMYEKNTIPLKGPNKTAGKIQNIKTQLLEILDSEMVDPSGAYKIARQTFAEPAQLKKAMEMGYSLFRVKNTDKIGYGLQDVARMSAPELDGFIRGVGFSVRDVLQEGPESASAIRRLVKGPKREILRRAINDDSRFDMFIKELDDELMMFETSSQLLGRGQSRTEPLKREIDNLVSRAGGNNRMSAEGFLSTIASKIIGEGAEISKDKTMRILSDMLMTPASDVKKISKLLTGDVTDQIYNAVNAIVSSSLEKTGRRTGAIASDRMGVQF